MHPWRPPTSTASPYSYPTSGFSSSAFPVDNLNFHSTPGRPTGAAPLSNNQALEQGLPPVPTFGSHGFHSFSKLSPMGSSGATHPPHSYTSADPAALLDELLGGASSTARPTAPYSGAYARGREAEASLLGTQAPRAPYLMPPPPSSLFTPSFAAQPQARAPGHHFPSLDFRPPQPSSFVRPRRTVSIAALSNHRFKGLPPIYYGSAEKRHAVFIAESMRNILLMMLSGAEVKKASRISRTWYRGAMMSDLWEELCKREWANKSFVPAKAKALYTVGQPYSAYEYAFLDKMRCCITREELCSIAWKVRFREAAGPDMHAFDPWWGGFDPLFMLFRPDGTATTERRDGGPHEPGNHNWRFLVPATSDSPTSASHSNGYFVHMDDFVPWVVCRDPRDWSWLLVSPWVVLSSGPTYRKGHSEALTEDMIDGLVSRQWGGTLSYIYTNVLAIEDEPTDSDEDIASPTEAPVEAAAIDMPGVSQVVATSGITMSPEPSSLITLPGEEKAASTAQHFPQTSPVVSTAAQYVVPPITMPSAPSDALASMPWLFSDLSLNVPLPAGELDSRIGALPSLGPLIHPPHSSPIEVDFEPFNGLSHFPAAAPRSSIPRTEPYSVFNTTAPATASSAAGLLPSISTSVVNTSSSDSR